MGNCDDKGPVERAGKTVEQVTEKVTQTAKDAADKLQPGGSQVGKVVQEESGGKDEVVKK